MSRPDNAIDCPDCGGSGEAPYERCCSGLHCACHGRPQYVGDCITCDGNGWVMEEGR